MSDLHDLLTFAAVANSAGFTAATAFNLKMFRAHAALAQQSGGEICDSVWGRHRALCEAHRGRRS